MKKIISYLLMTALTLQIGTVFCLDYEGHWAKESIEHLMSENILPKEQNVAPNAEIKRYEFAVLVNKTCLFVKESGEAFADVREDKPYYRDMMIAKAAGYLTGDTDNNADPESDITRSEVAVILARLYGLKPQDTQTVFSDSQDIPKWAAGSIKILSEKNIFKGYEDNTFRPYKTLSKGEAYTICARIDRLINTNEDFDGGDGSDRFPYIVSTAEQLTNVKKYSDSHFRQVREIDLTGETKAGGSLHNNGKGLEPIPVLQGSYDGGGFAVKGVFINRPTMDNGGLFKENRGEITNLIITEADVTAKSTAGILCANNYGSISNCRTAGKISAVENVGGIVGYNQPEGKILNSRNNAAVEGEKYVGGIAGYNKSALIDNAECLAGISASGLTEGYAGGIVGFNDGGAKILNSRYLVNSKVKGMVYAGGICGYNRSSEIRAQKYKIDKDMVNMDEMTHPV